MCFEKAFHVILMHFYLLYLMLWGVIFKNQVFFYFLFILKRDVFPEFRLIQTVFQSIEISFKILGEPLSVSIDRNCFSINQISWIRFFKKQILTFSKSLFQKFSKLFSLSVIRTWLHLSFLSFFIILFARFLSLNTGKTLLPFFLLLFSHFMHFNLGISNLYIFGVFDD